MSFQSDLLVYLATKAGLTALVSTRIYPQLASTRAFRVSQTGAAYPYIVIQQISGDHVRHMQGPSGLAKERYQFDCIAETQTVANQVAEQLRLALDGYRGDMGTGPTQVQGAFLLDEGDTLDASPDQDKARAYGVRQDYEIWHDEVKPVFS